MHANSDLGNRAHKAYTPTIAEYATSHMPHGYDLAHKAITPKGLGFVGTLMRWREKNTRTPYGDLRGGAPRATEDMIRDGVAFSLGVQVDLHAYEYAPGELQAAWVNHVDFMRQTYPVGYLALNYHLDYVQGNFAYWQFAVHHDNAGVMWRAFAKKWNIQSEPALVRPPKPGPIPHDAPLKPEPLKLDMVTIEELYRQGTISPHDYERLTGTILPRSAG